MVKLEWQNALYATTKGKTQIIPVRIDDCEMPAVLKQTLFIDMHTVGLDASIAQIVSVTQGNASFTPQHQGFSNLSYTSRVLDDESIEITIKASHLMEPNPHFGFLTKNQEGEIGWGLQNKQPFLGGFNKEATVHEGKKINVISIRPMSGTLTPSHPFRASFIKKAQENIEIITVFHEKSENQWVPIPKTT